MTSKVRAGPGERAGAERRRSTTKLQPCSRTYPYRRVKGGYWRVGLGMVTDLYAHILDEDRKVNAQRFEAAFYASPDMRNTERQSAVRPEPPSSAPDLQQLVKQLQQNPELAGQLAALLKGA